MISGKSTHETITNSGTFIGSAVGQGSTVSNNTISNNTITVGEARTQVSLDELRNAIAATRDDLVGAAEDPDAKAVVRYLIRTIEGELAKDQPRGTEVSSRWDEVSKMLSPLATASGIVAQITGLITKVFGES
ncbi:MAG: hypothetical protein M3460_19530 [Actinomycetota bacterium]|nr:hypothetical protein [Actinomycetota bacterium]